MSKFKIIFSKVKFSFRKIFGYTITTAKTWIRTGPALFFTFIYPIVMILLFGYIFSAGGDDSLFTLHYMNEDVYQVGDQYFSHNPASQLLLKLGYQNDTHAKELNLNLQEVSFDTSQISANDWMKDNDIPYLLIIPDGWSLAVNESKINSSAPIASVDYYYDPSYTSSIEVQTIIDSVLHEMNLEEFSIATFVQVETVTTPSREGLNYIDFYVPGIIMVTISTAGMMGLVGAVAEERETGLTYKLSSTPLKKWEWSLSHLLWQAVMSIIVAILTALTGWIAFGFNMATIHPLMIVALVFGSMTFSGLALILSYFVRRSEAAMAVTMAFVFPQMFLAGAIFPAELLPSYMQTVAKIFPLYYISESLRNMMLESTFHKVWLNLGITIAMGIVFFIVGSIITRWRKE